MKKIFYLLFQFTFETFLSPDGEIGRRTAFRWQHSQGCAGSNPVPGTRKACKLLFTGFFIAIRHFIIITAYNLTYIYKTILLPSLLLFQIRTSIFITYRIIFTA